MSDAILAAQQLGIRFRRCNADEARKLRESVELVYRDSYTDLIASGNPFDSIEAFMDRFERYNSIPEFDLVVAYHNDDPVGQAWGWPLRQTSGWWRGVKHARGDDLIREDGKRTFALSEIMVVESWTRKGIAHALHDTLLSGRYEERATLLVEPDNAHAQRVYEQWGWTKVGELQPSWEGAPVFDVMVKPLGG